MIFWSFVLDPRWASRAAIVLATALLAVACGKKGPPLAPIVHVPAAPTELRAQRIGDDVYVTMTVPSANIDGTRPADVSRVDLYAATTDRSMPAARLLVMAPRVAVAQVLPPVEPGGPGMGQAGPVQGGPVTLHDRLTGADLVARQPPVAAGPVARTAPSPSSSGAAPPPLQRAYVAVAFSDRGRPSPPAQLDLPLTRLPSPPGEIALRYTERVMTISWDPGGGVVGFLTAQARPIEPAPDGVRAAVPASEPPNASLPRAARTPAAPAVPAGIRAAAPDAELLPLPEGPTRYFVYRDLSPDPLALPASPAPPPGPPVPLNAVPTADLTLADTVLFGRDQCYVVRSVRGTAPTLVVGRPSPRVCVRPVDTFPPAAPTGLAAIVTPGAISLIWDPSDEADLGGYVVLRGEAGSATLQPLTPTPVPIAQYTDRTVVPGQRYTYAVAAVDTHLPVPNTSAPSTPVEDMAR